MVAGKVRGRVTGGAKSRAKQDASAGRTIAGEVGTFGCLADLTAPWLLALFHRSGAPLGRIKKACGWQTKCQSNSASGFGAAIDEVQLGRSGRMVGGSR